MTGTQNTHSSAFSDPVTAAERKLLVAATTGKEVDLRTGDPIFDDPVKAVHWKPDRTVRAEFVTDLLIGNQTTLSGNFLGVKLRGARISGPIDLDSCKILCPMLFTACYFDDRISLVEAEAPLIRLDDCIISELYAAQLKVVRGLSLSGLVATSGIYLNYAHIGGILNLIGADISSDNSGRALFADGISIDQSMLCKEGFTVKGEISLRGAHIGSALDFNGAKIINRDGTALNGYKLIVAKEMSCSSGFTVHGQTELSGAHIGGSLNLSSAKLTAPDGYALHAKLLTVDQDLTFGGNFTAEGQILLSGAHVGGTVNFSDSTISSSGDETALYAELLTVDHDMLCGEGFIARGGIILDSASIGGLLEFGKAELTNQNGCALGLWATTTNGLILPEKRPSGNVDLTNSNVGVLTDYSAGWPHAIQLRGLIYDSLVNGDDISPRKRIRWLALQPQFAPQTYDQLAAVYRNAGEIGAARMVSISKERRRRKIYNPLSWLWWSTVGYGYRTWQALIWLGALTLVGSLVFGGVFFRAPMVPLSASHPRFQPVIYALDLLLPIVGLGQKSAWQPGTPALQDWAWALTFAGWVLSAAIVAGLTGILKRD